MTHDSNHLPRKIRAQRALGEAQLNVFRQLIQPLALGRMELEYRFCRRRWRFDIAFPDLYLAVEIEGGIWVRGRHTRPVGFKRDIEKYNTAASLGWLVFRIAREDWDRFNFDQLIMFLKEATKH